MAGISAARREGFVLGLREAFGLPALTLTASYLGFGSLVHSTGLGFVPGLATTFGMWALPGQVALVELYGAGASFLVIAATVALTNARFLPMTVVLMPHLRTGHAPRWVFYAVAHLVAVTSWVFAMQRCPQLAEEKRLPYFFGLTFVLWLGCFAGTAGGFVLAGGLPHVVSLGLVFLNPLYFMLIFAADLRERARLYSLAVGAVLGPLFHLLSPEWGLPLTGIVAGTLAFALDRHARGREAKRHG
ncbi:MAG: AzlC family ABC transporter permease [Alphaproteobacteria bacterium]